MEVEKEELQVEGILLPLGEFPLKVLEPGKPSKKVIVLLLDIDTNKELCLDH